MAGPPTTLPSDPRHPDNELYQRLLAGVEQTANRTPEQNANLASALYAHVRDRQPHITAADIGDVVASAPGAAQASLFAVARNGYHTHDPDPAALRFGVPLGAVTRPSQESLAPYARVVTVGADGFLTDPGITRTPVAGIEHAAMSQVNGIVLHRTESSTASSTLNSWRTRTDGVGAHFLIDRDGTIHQTASVERQAWHVGAIRSRGEVEGTITADDQREIEAARAGRAEWTGTAARAVGRLEATRPYPERYPTNGDSIGIEVVGRFNPATQAWDAPTPEQTASIRRLVGSLQNNFGLDDHDVYQHDVISRKTLGEGAGLYTPALPAPAAPDAGVPPAGPAR